MTAKERRARLYQLMAKAKEQDPGVYARLSTSSERIALQAFRSSRMEGCNVKLGKLRKTARALVKTEA
jgi:hypothetical protein